MCQALFWSSAKLLCSHGAYILGGMGQALGKQKHDLKSKDIVCWLVKEELGEKGVLEGLTCKMTLEQKCHLTSDGHEGASHLAIWRKSIPGRGNGRCKDPGS